MLEAVRQTYDQPRARRSACSSIPSNSPSPGTGHLRILGHDRLELSKQLTMGRDWEMTFGSFDDQPAERQGTTVVDHTQHQGQTATTDSTAIHHDLDRLSSQGCEQLLSDRQKPAIKCVAVVLQETSEAPDQRFLAGAVARSVIGNDRQVGMSAASQSTDQGRQGIEMFFTMTSWARLIELHNGLFYGTIASIRITHGVPPDWI